MKKVFLCFILMSIVVFLGCSYNNQTPSVNELVNSSDKISSEENLNKNESLTTTSAETFVYENEQTSSVNELVNNSDKFSSEENFNKNESLTTTSAETFVFKNEPIFEVYSLNYDDRQYHKVTDNKIIKSIISKLDNFSIEVPKESSQYGFLIVTDNNKYAYYLVNNELKANEKDRELINLSKECNNSFSGYIQWLSYMSITNITNVYVDSIYCDKSIESTSKDDIEIIGNFLKSISVNSDVKIKQSSINPHQYISYLTIDFKSGVRHNIYFLENYLVINSSDRREEIWYSYKSATNTISELKKVLREII